VLLVQIHLNRPLDEPVRFHDEQSLAAPPKAPSSCTRQRQKIDGAAYKAAAQQENASYDKFVY
jgi:hypothetical protein